MHTAACSLHTVLTNRKPNLKTTCKTPTMTSTVLLVGPEPQAQLKLPGNSCASKAGIPFHLQVVDWLRAFRQPAQSTTVTSPTTTQSPGRGNAQALDVRYRHKTHHKDLMAAADAP